MSRVTAQARYTWMRHRLLEALVERDGTACCRGCGRPVDITMTSDGNQPDAPSFDHFPKAIAEGGADHISNLALAHLKCNRDHGVRLAAMTRAAAAVNRRRGFASRRRWGPVDGQGTLDLNPEPSRRSFLVAAPLALIAAKLVSRAPAPMTTYAAPTRLHPALKHWVDNGVVPIKVSQADRAAVIGIPDALLDDPAVNLWAWVRPRIAEALEAAS